MKKGTQAFLVIIAAVWYVGYQVNQSSSSSSSNVANTNVAVKVNNTQPFNLSWPGEVSENPSNESYFSKNYYVVLDGSGSMDDVGCSNGKKKLIVAKKALSSFVDLISPSDNIGLFVFDFNGVDERVSLGVKNRDLLKSEIDKIRAGGRTPLGSSLEIGFDKLTQAGKEQLGYGEYHIVVLTDGIASDTELVNQAVSKIITKSPIVVHTVGFCIGNDHTLNQKGKTYYKAANDPESLVQGLGDVLAESESFSVASFE